MKTVQIKNITVGEGAPKIIVSLMAKDLAAVKSEAAAYAAADFDILEWRGALSRRHRFRRRSRSAQDAARRFPE